MDPAISIRGAALRVISAMTILLPCGCALEGAPFPSSFKMTGPGQFEFVARGNWIYPADMSEGEAERMAWLTGYISEHHICPFGYTIVERTPERSTGPPKLGRKGSPRASPTDPVTGSVKYVGRCEPSPRGRMTGDPALYLFRPRQLCLAMPCGELRCSWPEIRFLRLLRAAERLHWNNLNADGPALGTGSCGGLGRVNSGHA